MEFIVGDRVKYGNETGRVVNIPSPSSIGVEFERSEIHRHNCDGYARDKHGWYVNKYFLERINDIDAVLDDFPIDDAPLTEGIPTTPQEFQNGDRVHDPRNGYGRVVDYRSPGNVGVSFDERVEGGHNCNGFANLGHGWYVPGQRLRRVDEPEIQPVQVSDSVDELERALLTATQTLMSDREVTLDVSAVSPQYESVARKLKRAVNQNPFDPPYEPENREVKPMKLNELTQGLPLLGLRVMINPDKYGRYNSRYHGQSGIVTDLRGNTRDAYRHIARYKRGGKAEGWAVTVRFDNGKSTDVDIADLLPVIPEKEVILHEFNFSGGDIYYWTPEEYEENIDKYVISYQYPIHEHKVWNDELRQKVLDEH